MSLCRPVQVGADALVLGGSVGIQKSRLAEPALFVRWAASSLNGIADIAKNGADLSAQEEQRNDRHDLR